MMYHNLAGEWNITLHTERGMQTGRIRLPGILQGQGFGNPITKDTSWVSGLHDPFWWEREEYPLENKIPFLSQPPRHFLGKAWYEREIVIEEETDKNWYVYIENTHWRTRVYINDVETGTDCSLCTSHRLFCGRLQRGNYRVKIEIDNSMQYPYRPDGHGVSDALGATWNGMVGEIALLTEDELEKRKQEKMTYASQHPRKMEIKAGCFFVDGRKEYFRGTHFGGDYPLTGYPNTDLAWWRKLMQIVKAWGLNFIRCHSYCPPEAAFLAADEAGIYLQPECGMWNYFAKNIPMLDVLREETRRILQEYGHHPSFVLFSPTNEPDGDWYQVLKSWVEETRAYDKELGYEGRRVYTAESGWFYDVPPFEVEGVDYLYFHRSNYGPFLGGTIRNSAGWRGGDYAPSLGNTDKPVICHEMGQWCAYPDFDVIEKFQGYLIPGNYQQFRENCRRSGMISLNKSFAYASGRNQLRLYKEDIEANLRTPHLFGFEMLDLHDYLGQGTALVGVLDAFWEEKGYVKSEEFRQFCNDTVLLARFPSYVYAYDCENQIITYEGKQLSQYLEIPIELCHFGKEALHDVCIYWQLIDNEVSESVDEQQTILENVLEEGIVNYQNENKQKSENHEKNIGLGKIRLTFKKIFMQQTCVSQHKKLSLRTYVTEKQNKNHIICKNTWDFYVYKKSLNRAEYRDNRNEKNDKYDKYVTYTREWEKAKACLQEGKRVIYAPYLSSLGYTCPSLSIKNVFWNAQMGPTWDRSLGLLVKKEHPLFRYFPSDEDGGWQWEDILSHARGFCLPKEHAVEELIVRVIDDWNRNLPLSLILETQIGTGKLLLVSADLEGEFESRPAAYALKEALIKYAASEKFIPTMRMDYEDIEAQLFPVYRMEQLADKITFQEDAQVEQESALVTANPNTVTQITRKDFPITIDIGLKRQVDVKGVMYVPDQKARDRRGFVKEYELLAWSEEDEEYQQIGKGILKNSCLPQKIKVNCAEGIYRTDRVRLVVHSIYGDKNIYEWKTNQEGYQLVKKQYTAQVRLAGFHVICDEKVQETDSRFWLDEGKTRGMCKTEIEA